jgi:hypothetical protein
MPVWTDDQTAALQTMAGEGYTGGQIANAIAERFGVKCSRNAVIGKLHRMGLGLAGPQPERLSKSKPGYGGKPKAAPLKPALQPAPQPKQKSSVPVPRPPSETVTFRGLKPRRCRYPYGDRWPFKFCAAKAVEGTSWCEAHYHLVFRPP